MKLFKWEKATFKGENFLIKVGMEINCNNDYDFNIEDFLEEEIYDVYNVKTKKLKKEIIKKFKQKAFRIKELEGKDIMYVFLEN